MENDSTFVAPEGVYSVTEEHKHGLMGMHTVNPTNLTFPTKLKTVTIKFVPSKIPNSQVLSQLLGGNREKENKKEKEREKQLAKEREDGLSVSSSETPEDIPSPDTSAFSPSPDSVPTHSLPHEQLNNIFSPTPAAPGKKKAALGRPKHNMRTTSSTFITRLQSVDNLNRNLQSKQGEVTFLLYNSGKSYIWTEAGIKAKVRIVSFSESSFFLIRPSGLQEPLARVFFSAYPTCHDINLTTVSSERIDIILGFNTGDILWLGRSFPHVCLVAFISKTAQNP